jgi:diguanylate cyclase (GGDEF)-like protein
MSPFEAPAPQNEPCGLVLALLRQALRVAFTVLTITEPGGRLVKARYGADFGAGHDPASLFRDAILARSAPLVIEDTRADPRFATSDAVATPPFIRSHAGLRLRHREGHVMGCLSVMDLVPRHFSAEELGLLEGFARLAADELRLRDAAATDHLSGALSRRAWSELAEIEFARARRYARPLSLAMFDIDRFKAINDTYGHAAGDVVIRKISEICQVSLRQSDLFGRFGGEEFVLMMPETTQAGAYQVAERIRGVFGNSASDFGEPVFTTVSIGITQLHAGDSSPQMLIERADRALYRAKRQGRNQTVLDGMQNVRELADG